MSSSGEKRMTKKSDFAQKLLDDLRMRKEQLSNSADNYANSNKGFNRSKETRAKSTTFQDFNYKGTKSFTGGIEAFSNQMVPYGKGRSMEKLDLSKALAFALENAGKATKGDLSGNASIISFLHEVGKRSLGYGKDERRRGQQQLPSSRSQKLPIIHVHIKDISKGTQKLNQIIKACSDGLGFRKGRYSVQCGEQLMEGAVELEHSLRLLIDIQKASSEYKPNKLRNNRIKLLEENDEDEEEEAEYRFHREIKEVTKANIEMTHVPLNYQEDKFKKHRRQGSGFEDNTERSMKHEPKGRIPSVVAKLMGLGEFPKNEKETKNKNEASFKNAENLTRHRVMKVSENGVEVKTQRLSTTMDLAIHKETKTVNDKTDYKAKSHQKDRHDDDLRGVKRNNILNKMDGESKAKTQKKDKFVPRSQQHQPSHKLNFEKKLDFHSSWRGEEEMRIKKYKSQQEKPKENGVMTIYSPRPLSSVEIQKKLPLKDKSKVLMKSLSHGDVAQKVKEGEVHKAEIREKKTQEICNPNGGFCIITKRTKIQKLESKNDQLLGSYYKESTKKIAEAAATSISSSEVGGVDVQSPDRNDMVEHKKDIRDDSILLIAAERVKCSTPSENQQQHRLIFTDEIDQVAPLLESNGISERLSKTVNKGTKSDVEPNLPLLEKRQERKIQQPTEPLSENEMNLKKIVVKSQLFLDTAKSLFKLNNIPLEFLHDVEDGTNYHQEDKNLFLDCGYELMKRKGRYQELSVHPFVKVPISSSKVNSLDNLVRQLSKEFEKVRAYGKECYSGSFVEDFLPQVLERDVNRNDLTSNSMWDMGWNDFMSTFIEKDDVIRDIEREIFNGLLEEMTRSYTHISVTFEKIPFQE